MVQHATVGCIMRLRLEVERLNLLALFLSVTSAALNFIFDLQWWSVPVHLEQDVDQVLAQLSLLALSQDLLLKPFIFLSVDSRRLGLLRKEGVYFGHTSRRKAARAHEKIREVAAMSPVKVSQLTIQSSTELQLRRAFLLVQVYRASAVARGRLTVIHFPRR